MLEAGGSASALQGKAKMGLGKLQAKKAELQAKANKAFGGGDGGGEAL